MIRVYDLDAALHFFVDLLGLTIVRRSDRERGRYTLVFLSTDRDDDTAMIELTYNWDQEEAYSGGRNFGHLAFAVDDICTTASKSGLGSRRGARGSRTCPS